MRKEYKSRIRQTVYTVLGILFVGVLFFVARIVPEYYCRIYDKSTLDKVSSIDINVNTFETSYESFIEKIYALARANAGKNGLRAVRMNEIGIEMDRSELTEIANAELAKLSENKVLSKKIKLKEKQMSLCERYTIYETNEADSLQGISCCKLGYESKNRSVTMYLDEEYHKIYYLEVQNRKNTDEDGIYEKPFAKVGNNQSGQSDIVGEKLQNLFLAWWNGVVYYYDLVYSSDEVPYVAWPEEEELCGVVEFDEKYRLNLYASCKYDEYGNEIWQMGIPMEKMIQF